MPRVGFELTIPVIEREKTVYAVDFAGAVIVKIKWPHRELDPWPSGV
jgi:hypothetical protein